MSSSRSSNMSSSTESASSSNMSSSSGCSTATKVFLIVGATLLIVAAITVGVVFAVAGTSDSKTSSKPSSTTKASSASSDGFLSSGVQTGSSGPSEPSNAELKNKQAAEEEKKAAEAKKKAEEEKKAEEAKKKAAEKEKAKSAPLESLKVFSRVNQLGALTIRSWNCADANNEFRDWDTQEQFPQFMSASVWTRDSIKSPAEWIPSYAGWKGKNCLTVFDSGVSADDNNAIFYGGLGEMMVPNRYILRNKFGTSGGDFDKLRGSSGMNTWVDRVNKQFENQFSGFKGGKVGSSQRPNTLNPVFNPNSSVAQPRFGANNRGFAKQWRVRQMNYKNGASKSQDSAANDINSDDEFLRWASKRFAAWRQGSKLAKKHFFMDVGLGVRFKDAAAMFCEDLKRCQALCNLSVKKNHMQHTDVVYFPNGFKSTSGAKRFDCGEE